MSGIIEYGWRRFNTQKVTTAPNEYFAAGGYRGGCMWWLAEIENQSGYPTKFGSGRDYYQNNGFSIQDWSSNENDNLILSGAMISPFLTSLSSTDNWDFKFSARSGSDVNYTGAVWTSDTSRNYKESPYSGLVLNYSYVFLNGTLRQSIGGFTDGVGAGMGSGNPVLFPKPLMTGSLIIGFNSPGAYFYGDGYQSDINNNGWNVDSSGRTYHYWTLLTDAPAWDGNAVLPGNPVPVRWFCTWARTGGEWSIDEGWTTEQLGLKGRIVTLTGNPGKGTLSLYDDSGKRLTYGTDWDWYLVAKNQIKLRSQISTSYVVATYLNIQSRLRYGYKSRVIISQSTNPDRIKFNDVKGL